MQEEPCKLASTATVIPSPRRKASTHQTSIKEPVSNGSRTSQPASVAPVVNSAARPAEASVPASPAGGQEPSKENHLPQAPGVPLNHTLSSLTIWNILLQWTTTDEESLTRLADATLLQDTNLRRFTSYNINLVRRTARRMAGLILGGMFDYEGQRGRATSESLRQWLLNLLE